MRFVTIALFHRYISGSKRPLYEGFSTLEFLVLSSARARLVFGIWLSCTLVQFCIMILQVSYSQYNTLLDRPRAEMNAATGINRSMNRPASGCAKLLNTKLALHVHIILSSTWRIQSSGA